MTDMEIAVGLMEEGSSSSDGGTSHVRQGRTSEDFFKFVTYILEYAKYVAENNEDNRSMANQTPPPLDSSGSSNNSETISVDSNLSAADDRDIAITAELSDDSGAEEETLHEIKEEDEDPDEKVTCYCQKPFAGRPMIECSRCSTWIHLSCAKIRKNNIPDVFHCAICKGNKRPSSPPPPSQSPPGVKRVKKSISTGSAGGFESVFIKTATAYKFNPMLIYDYQIKDNVLSGSLACLDVIKKTKFLFTESNIEKNMVLVDPLYVNVEDDVESENQA